MVNVLIKESDVLFQRGLTYFFTEFFSQTVQQEVCFNFSFTVENVRVADVIVLSLCPGECFTCFPELQDRKKGVVIGFVEDDQQVKSLPSCFEDILFISRRASLTKVKNALYSAWQQTKLPNYRRMPFSCFDCQQKTLSPQQVRIMVSLYKGLSVSEIADEMRISDKTVFTHKYMTMNKFSLRSDFELVLLLKTLAEKKSGSNIFYQYLNR